MKRNLKFAAIILAAAASTAFFSCKSKTESYKGHEIIVDEDGTELIRLPRVIDQLGNLDSAATEYYPLSLYKAEEAQLLELASLYNQYDGIDQSKANKIKNTFADLRDGSFNNLITDEAELEKVDDWYKNLKAKMYDTADFEISWNSFGYFQSILYDGVKNITQLLVDVNEFNQGDSWFDSLEELFEFNKVESTETIRKIIKLFPQVTFISDLSQRNTTPETNNFDEVLPEKTEEEVSAESFDYFEEDLNSKADPAQIFGDTFVDAVTPAETETSGGLKIDASIFEDLNEFEEN